ncbi:MAG: hypothetical protein AAFV96_18180 [Pseudomonadota bacterium]
MPTSGTWIRRSTTPRRAFGRPETPLPAPAGWAKGAAMQTQTFLDFEKDVAELAGKVAELRAMARSNPALDVGEEADRLEARAEEILSDLYAALTPWRSSGPQRAACSQ